MNVSLTLLLKDFVPKSKFRRFENVYTSQFESAEYESDCFYFQPKYTFNIRQFSANQLNSSSPEIIKKGTIEIKWCIGYTSFRYSSPHFLLKWSFSLFDFSMTNIFFIRGIMLLMCAAIAKNKR